MNLKQSIRSIIIIAILGLFTLSAGPVVSAESIQDLKEKINQFESEKSNLSKKKNNLDGEKQNTQSKIEENMNEQKTVETEISEIEAELNQTLDEISKKENEITTTNEEIEELNNRIEILIEEVAVLEDKIEKRDLLLRDRLRTIQQSGGKMNYLQVIFGAKNFADFISRATAVNTIMDQDKTIMEAQAADQKLLEENKVEVEESKETVVAKKENLVSQKDELVALKDQLDNQKAERNTLMAQLEVEQEELEEIKLSIEDEQAVIAAEESAHAAAIAMAQEQVGELEQLAREEAERQRQEEERKRQEEAARKQREAEQAKASAEQESNEEVAVSEPAPEPEKPVVSAPPTGGSNGIFIHPANGRLTSGYGMRVHPIYKVPRLHAGVDFAVGTGTPLLAPADGVVSTASFRGGFGNVIMISHYINGQTYTTVSAHLSSMHVSPGQKVTQGQVIGATGNTGSSTGPHLHFEVHVGSYGNSVNPIPYLR